MSTPELRALRESAKEFALREVAPHLQEWEDVGEISRDLHRKAAAAGLLGISFDESVGGDGGDVLDTIALTEGMFAGGASSGLMAGLYTHGIALPHIVAASAVEERSRDEGASRNHGEVGLASVVSRLGAGAPRTSTTGGADTSTTESSRSSTTGELIERFVRPTLRGELIGSLAITEPDGGSDVARIRTTAVRDGDHYVVNGTKTFITSGVRADFVTTAVRTGGPGHGGISLLVIEKGTPGFTVDRSLAKHGWHCSDTAELGFADVRVPITNLIGAENSGFIQIASQFVQERLALAVHGYCLAQRCLDLTVEWCRQRETFGRPLISNQVVQHKLVEMRRQVDVARAHTIDVARRHVEGESVIADVCLAKQTACDTAAYVTNEAVQLHGGTGYLHGTEVERHYRDARLLPIGGGASEVLADLAAKLLGYTP